MLEQLFGSQTRLKLLQIFLNNPEKQYFVRELTRLVGSQINAVRRELDNLSTLGLIKIIIQDEDIPKDGKKSKLPVQKNKMKYYRVVTGFLLYPDLKNLIRKNQSTIEQELAVELQKIGPIQYLALTGKFVGMEHLPTDLLIVGSVSADKCKKIISAYEKKLNNEINYTLMDANEFSYRRSVADKFLYSVLDNKKIVMVDDLINYSTQKF